MDASQAGFAALVAAHSAALGRTAFLLTGDRHLGEDLLQEALARVASRSEKIGCVGLPPAACA